MRCDNGVERAKERMMGDAEQRTTHVEGLVSHFLADVFHHHFARTDACNINKRKASYKSESNNFYGLFDLTTFRQL